MVLLISALFISPGRPDRLVGVAPALSVAACLHYRSPATFRGLPTDRQTWTARLAHGEEYRLPRGVNLASSPLRRAVIQPTAASPIGTPRPPSAGRDTYLCTTGPEGFRPLRLPLGPPDDGGVIPCKYLPLTVHRDFARKQPPTSLKVLNLLLLLLFYK